MEGTPIKGIIFGEVGYVIHCGRDDMVFYDLNMVMNILMFPVCFMPNLLYPCQQIFGYQLIVMEAFDEFGLKVNMVVCLNSFPLDLFRSIPIFIQLVNDLFVLPLFTSLFFSETFFFSSIFAVVNLLISPQFSWWMLSSVIYPMFIGCRSIRFK